jgi:hypothetical protein
LRVVALEAFGDASIFALNLAGELERCRTHVNITDGRIPAEDSFGYEFFDPSGEIHRDSPRFRAVFGAGANSGCV